MFITSLSNFEILDFSELYETKCLETYQKILNTCLNISLDI